MQYENVFKSDRWCSCYTCLPCTVPAAQTAQKMAPGTGTGAPPVALKVIGCSSLRGGGGELGTLKT